MVLFPAESLYYSVRSPLKILVKLAGTACILPEQISKLNRITERIHLILALPQPVISL